MPNITGHTRLAGVIGWPVSHSRSPKLHNHWLERHGVDGAYVPLPVAPEHLAAAVAGLRAAGFRGLNVTIPHKEAVARLCDSLDPSARRAGAVNTLVFDGGRTIGSNTDGAGFIANVRAHGAPLGPTLLLGAGGGARAIAAALLDIGVPVTVANRSQARAQALAAHLPGLHVVPWSERIRLDEMLLLVNTTSLGMDGQPPLDMDLRAASDQLVVADIVYAPLETPLLRRAKAKGLLAVGGLGMLLHQARAGFTAWFGLTPVIDPALEQFVAGA